MFSPIKGLIAFSAAILLLLAACDSEISTKTSAPIKTVAAKTPELDFPKETAVLTRQCLAVLESKSASVPNLSKYGYVYSRDKSWIKYGPKRSYFEGPRTFIALRFRPHKTNNACYIVLSGHNSGNPENRVYPVEKKARDAAATVSRSFGYRGTITKGRLEQRRETLLKAGAAIAVLVTLTNPSGVRKMQFLYEIR